VVALNEKTLNNIGRGIRADAELEKNIDGSISIKKIIEH
jgi:hypothetical protein